MDEVSIEVMPSPERFWRARRRQSDSDTTAQLTDDGNRIFDQAVKVVLEQRQYQFL